MEEHTVLGKEARGFLAELSRNNNRAWFEEHKNRYEQELLAPAEAFVLRLGPRLKELYPRLNYGTQKNGTGSIMRIYRDVRFSKDKRPYKENLGLIFWIGEGKKVELPCFYFHLDTDSCFFYGGRHLFPKEILDTYRRLAADEVTGGKLESVLSALDRDGLPLMEEPAWKKVPAGFPQDHPRELLLRLGGLGVSLDLAGQAEDNPRLADICAEAAKSMKPLMDWLELLG